MTVAGEVLGPFSPRMGEAQIGNQYMNDVERSITGKYWRVLGHARQGWFQVELGWIPLLEGLLQDLDKVLTDEQIAHLRIQEIGEKRGRLDVVFDCPDWLRETVQDSVSNAVME